MRRRQLQQRFAESLSSNVENGAIRETNCRIQVLGPHASFLDEAPLHEDSVYDDVALLTHRR